jgi:hypothetical protein
MKNILVGLIVSLAYLTSAQVLNAEKIREFSSGYAGTLPTDPKFLARAYFENASIRNLIYELESGPVSVFRVEQALLDSEFSIEDLLGVGLVREEADQFFLNFNYFTLEDMHAIHQVIDDMALSLSQGYLDRSDEFGAIFGAYPVKTVSPKKLAFILISGFSLNWDGLKETQDMGFRAPNLVAGEGWKYSFWAAENDPEYSTHEFYWGSSSFPLGEFNFQDNPVDFAFSSFGDPYSDPRMNFPDLFYISEENLPSEVSRAIDKIGSQTETHFGLNIENVLGLDWTHDVGTILFALRENPRTEAELSIIVERVGKLPELMGLLQSIEYVNLDSRGEFQLLIPALDYEDQEMVNRALELSREILNGWLKSNYPAIRRELKNLTAIRQGVSFESLFTQIWHDLFGLATRELAHAGFTEDPSAEGVKYKGSQATIWRHSLYDFDPQ